MKLGFDVDGVLAYFDRQYRKTAAEVTGRNMFKPDPPGAEMGPATWNWDLDCGYTKGEVSMVWDAIKANPRFWVCLDALSGARTLALCINAIEQQHEVYFITNRMGRDAKGQTEAWLRAHIGLENPTVLICADKGAACRALRLDAYIDDNADNVINCWREVAEEEQRAWLAKEKPKFATRVYLLNKNYNLNVEVSSAITRVQSVGQFLDYELVMNSDPEVMAVS